MPPPACPPRLSRHRLGRRRKAVANPAQPPTPGTRKSLSRNCKAAQQRLSEPRSTALVGRQRSPGLGHQTGEGSPIARPVQPARAEGRCPIVSPAPFDRWIAHAKTRHSRRSCSNALRTGANAVSHRPETLGSLIPGAPRQNPAWFCPPRSKRSHRISSGKVARALFKIKWTPGSKTGLGRPPIRHNAGALPKPSQHHSRPLEVANPIPVEVQHDLCPLRQRPVHLRGRAISLIKRKWLGRFSIDTYKSSDFRNIFKSYQRLVPMRCFRSSE